MDRLIRLCIFIFAIACSASAVAQTIYGNEWIDYNKTYYKFKVGKEGVYRIPKSALDAAGIPTLQGQQFILYRDGQEVPIYTSNNSTFGTNDYIEFYGTKADGKLDKLLYQNPDWQPTDRINLFTDTACYYLTFDNGSGHLRYAQGSNTIPPVPPPPDSYCFATVGNYYKNYFCSGKSHSTSNVFPASNFDIGEGFTHQAVSMQQTFNIALATPNKMNNGAATINATVLASVLSPADQPIRMSMNNQLIADSVFHFSQNISQTKKFSLQLAVGQLAANNDFSFQSAFTGIGLSEYGLSYIEVTYPRNLDLAGLNFFRFRLTPASNNQYLEFLNFNNGNPVKLYDLTSRKYYEGDMTTPGKVLFYIDAAGIDREFLIYQANSPEIHNIGVVKNIQFTNYNNTANQGNYVILSHAALMAGGNVQAYRNYRASAEGGSYTALTADVTELYDQFAYGNDIHPLSIKRFLQFAQDNWTTKPENAFLIGKGIVYDHHKTYQNNPSVYTFPIVPTFGHPGSDVDFVNFGNDREQKIKIGRLPAWNDQEVGNYLQKVKDYETAMRTDPVPTTASEFWKKQVLHIAGSPIQAEVEQFLLTLGAAATIIQDTAMGASVTAIGQNTSSGGGTTSSKYIDSLINNGLSYITYHGHAAASGFSFNLNNPDQHNSRPRLPIFLALGCDVAQIFEVTTNKTVSEKYVNSLTGGSVAMIASDNLQWESFHKPYLTAFYNSVSKGNYGRSLGTHFQAAYNDIMSPVLDDFTYANLQSMLLLGDPATVTYGPPKPDFHVSESGLSTNPVNINSATDSFTLKIVSYNLAKAVNDTVFIRVEHINPEGAVREVRVFPVPRLYNTDTSFVNITVDKNKDLGLNRYKITVDATSRFDEISEQNNTATLSVFIYSDNLIPVYPYEFSIVGQQGVTLKASSLNPFRKMGNYRIQIDTTELFNSPLRQEQTFASPGGVVKWTPTITYLDNKVYYWRCAFDSVVNGDLEWTTSSFIYMAGQGPGWNQSHYFQYKKNRFDSLVLDGSRVFNYPTTNYELRVYNAVLTLDNSLPWTIQDTRILVNNTEVQRSGCPPFPGTLQIMVFDSLTAQMWANTPAGVGGSYGICLNTRNQHIFEFPLNTINDRNNARQFLENIPNGNYVLIRNFFYEQPAFNPTYIDTWKNDTLTNGSGISLYHTVRNMGFTSIDNFTSEKVFNFFMQKGFTATVQQNMTADRTGRLDNIFNISVRLPFGTMTGRTIGPATAWQNLKWQTSVRDGLPQNDSFYVRVIGITNNNTETEVYSGTAQDLNLNFIDAAVYGKIKLQWYTRDSVNYTSSQLDYWRVLYSPVPEAALNPVIHFAFTDSVHIGQMMNFSVAIENLTELPMDSMLVRYRIIDAGSTTHHIADRRYKPLAGNDTLHASVEFDPRAYPGNVLFFVESNPDNDQPEQYHPNNLGYLPARVIKDELNPLVDVTFDGVHILDRDIVSAKPFIKIILNDENKFLKLDDTSLMKVYIRYPDDGPSVRREVPFDGTVAKFIATQNAEKNEATIEYRPSFPQDGIYELFVNGTDKTGNEAGTEDYRISFEVINKPTITNILNYPNPFSTSTSFLFTVTGSQIPSQFKIQVLTVTGKVVREITKNELGHLHIGRNITEYKWDGRDQYGQMLGNGVYLFRVVTSLNGNSIEHRASGADKFFKNGYGKMYIMR